MSLLVLQSVQASWSVFIVGQAVNFGLVPVPLRICFAMMLTFVFNIILALVDANAEAAEAASEAAEAAEAADAASALMAMGVQNGTAHG